MSLMAGTEAVHNELPMAPIWFGIITLIVFALLLAITFAFRGMSNRHDPAAFVPHGDGGGHDAGGH